MKKELTYLLLIASFVFAPAQTTKDQVLSNPNQTGGVYFAYPTPTQKLTAAPKGYEPFYISHYSRHGSRWLINDKDFSGVLEQLRKALKADALTANGKSALERLEKVWLLAEGHNGDLTELGARQQQQISQRMVHNFPAAFSGNSFVTGRSTVVPRCILSMAYFTNELKGLRPNVDITVESSDKYMKYLNHHTKESNEFRNQTAYWQQEKRQFKDESFRAERFVNNLFSDSDYIYNNIDAQKTLEAFYWIASDMQNIDTDISFYDLFTPDELFNAYQYINYQTYINDGSWPVSQGLIIKNAVPLVKNILEEAQDYIKTNRKGASLRFGHDGNIIPLLALLKIEGMYGEETDPSKIYSVFNTYQTAPMAANLQMVFYRNKKENILVKFMLNEREVKIPVETAQFPYYQWEDVEKHLLSVTN